MNASTPDKPKPPSPLKILIIGGPGNRKTTLLLQFPGVHVLDCDRNLDGPTKFLREGLKDERGVAKPLLPQLSYTWDDIRLDEKGTMLDIENCYDRVIDKLSLFKGEKEYRARSVVGLDSLSHVNEFIVRKVLKARGNKTYMEPLYWSDFASLAYTILVAKLEQTGKTVICTCHEEKVTEADKKNIMEKIVVGINPLFSGRVGDSLGAFFTDVWRVEKRAASAGQTELILQTDRSAKCEHLKNSLGMPSELNITQGFSVIEPYLRGRI